MKPIYIVTFLNLMLSSSMTAQQKEWQWIKQGGASIEGDETEEAYDIATDSDRNVYAVSAMGIHNLEIDGNTKTFYGSPAGTKSDYALASFACDGSYRWSKIIGGKNDETPPVIETDDNGFLYMAGKFNSCDENEQFKYPARIENDTILNQTSSSCSLMFLTKYDKDGNMLWFKQPMPPSDGSLAFVHTDSRGLVATGNGDLHWLVRIPQGSYANGAYTNNQPDDTWHILKYDSNGNFLGGAYLDMKLPGIPRKYLKMYRNPNNGNYYFTGRRSANGSQPSSDTIGGQQVSGSFYLASFDAQGNFQWLRQNTTSFQGLGSTIYGLDFDNENNIYMGGVFLGYGYDTFLGQNITEQIAPSFVMKTNPDATQVEWFSYNDYGSGWTKGDIKLRDNTLYLTDQGATQVNWGNQSVNIGQSGEGTEILFATFDKITGDCTGLDFIAGNNGHPDRGSALAIDANGDVLIGGQFEHILYDSNGGQVMNPNPSNTNFFIAKYATEPCPELGTSTWKTQSIKLWPNPANRSIHVSVLSPSCYRMYTITGQRVKTGKLNTGENSIDIEKLPSGLYLIETTNQQGNKQVKKIVKE